MRFRDRVLETSLTTGTGSYALAGAVAGHRTFAAAFGDGALTAYVATDGSNWEVGYGTLSGTTLSRVAILASSNGGAAVSWTGSDTLYLYSAVPAIVHQSLLTTHKGSAAPAWLPVGGLWVDDTADPWLFKIKTAGGSVTLGRIDATGLRFLSEQAQGANIVAASSIDIGAATGDFVHITGTTTITALGTVTAGVERTLVFDGALTLTHNATSLILFDAVNITTAAGMVVRVRSEGSGNWRQVGGYRAITSAILPAATEGAKGAVELATTAEVQGLADTGRAVTPAGLATIAAPLLLETLATTSGTTVTSGTLPACRAFLCVVNDVSGSGTANLLIAVSDDDGANFSGTITLDGGPGSAFERRGQVWIFGTGSAATNKVVQGLVGNAGDTAFSFGEVTSETGVTNKIRFSLSAGNFDGGSIRIYGFR